MAEQQNIINSSNIGYAHAAAASALRGLRSWQPDAPADELAVLSYEIAARFLQETAYYQHHGIPGITARKLGIVFSHATSLLEVAVATSPDPIDQAAAVQCALTDAIALTKAGDACASIARC